jgi:hypothetical protein
LERIIVCLLLCLNCISLASSQSTPTTTPNTAIRGHGSQNFVPVFTSPGTVGNSKLCQGSGFNAGDGGVILFGIGINNPLETLQLNVDGTADKDTFAVGDCNVGKCQRTGRRSNTKKTMKESSEWKAEGWCESDSSAAASVHFLERAMS